ncbi:DUF624 domain-containing protein [Nonomuraea phyllanthi]|uniref:DUF624 domain-containing protein n=1 Tax=Nonomuraea phyllanthi TaxID=2219224 RepID=A0A5C4WJZ3_9ACTN|nr:DUF624 domain-containing protein [Nonomuraea phyllanthi]KAB8194142.1 DUF624 domain-containing protein [Nonomuraea phyllanthi]
MNALLGWHTRLGEVGLRLFLLHLLWLGGTLAGGVVLGVFPATAAVYAVVRRDLMGRDEPSRLREEFATAWRREFRAANALGYAFLALWALLLLDRHVVATVDLGAAGPALAGLFWLLAVFLFGMSVAAGPLAAHFAESVPKLVVRSALFVLARPLVAGLNAVAVAVVLCVYYVVPGLVPVFGIAAPACLSFAYLWSTGLLPRPKEDQPAAMRRTTTPTSHSEGA